MKSTNLFSDFLLDSDADFFDMENETNPTAFVEFFSKPVYLILEDNQLLLLDIISPMYIYCKGILVDIPARLVSGRKQAGPDGELTPGDLVLLDWYTDAFAYCDHPQTWCLPKTFDRISNLELHLITPDIEYTCKLFAFCNGFQKREYSWKKITPIIRL